MTDAMLFGGYKITACKIKNAMRDTIKATARHSINKHLMNSYLYVGESFTYCPDPSEYTFRLHSYDQKKLMFELIKSLHSQIREAVQFSEFDQSELDIIDNATKKLINYGKLLLAFEDFDFSEFEAYCTSKK